MIRLISGLAFLLLLAAPVGADQRTELARLLVEAEKVAILTEEVDAVIGDIDLAVDWVSTSVGQNIQRDEALMNARRTHAGLDTAITKLRQRAQAVPRDLPQAMPLFWWTGRETRNVTAMADEAAMLLRDLGATMRAARKDDIAAMVAIHKRQSTDRAALANVWERSLDMTIALLPSGHPDRRIARAQRAFMGTNELFTARETEADADRRRDLTARLAERSLEVAAEMRAILDGDLPAGFADRVRAQILLLTGREKASDQLTLALLASYRRSLAIERDFAEWIAGQGRLEMEYWRDDWSTDLGDRFTRAHTRMDHLFRARTAENKHRAKLLADAARLVLGE